MKNKIAYAVILCLLTLVASGSANAMSLRELRALEKSNKQGPEYKRFYLIGVLEGILAANVQAVQAGAKPLFCLDGRRLDPINATVLFNTEMKRNADVYEADMPVDLVVLNALANAYSCN